MKSEKATQVFLLAAGMVFFLLEFSVEKLQLYSVKQ